MTGFYHKATDLIPLVFIIAENDLTIFPQKRSGTETRVIHTRLRLVFQVMWKTTNLETFK